jgi:hypothetical protein
MKTRACRKLVLRRESILNLESAALRDVAAGDVATTHPFCATHKLTCITCFGTCTC